MEISLKKRYQPNSRMIRYKYLNTVMLSDTMSESKRAGKSVQNYTCAQISATDFGWIKAYPMTLER